jgi:anaerobic ribonucleoside-triphosphate reductase activating protein
MNISTLELSIDTNGPGKRLCIWLQGCNLSCDGCFNTHTHPAKDCLLLSPAQVVEHIIAFEKEESIRGITITGGEPLQQPEEVMALLIQVPKNLDILLFTGYSIKEIIADPKKSAIVSRCDAALCGRYKAFPDMPPLACKKLLLSTGRIRKEDIHPSRVVELTVSKRHGLLTGFPW